MHQCGKQGVITFYANALQTHYTYPEMNVRIGMCMVFLRW